MDVNTRARLFMKSDMHSGFGMNRAGVIEIPMSELCGKISRRNTTNNSVCIYRSFSDSDKYTF